MKAGMSRSRPALVVVDTMVVIVFVAIGRSTHDHGLGVKGMVSTTWPFATGLSLSWLLLALRGRRGESLIDGVILTLLTVAIAMTLRVLSGQGAAFAFVLVTLGFLGTGFSASRVLRRCNFRARSRN